MWQFALAFTLVLLGLGPGDCACEARTGWHCADFSTSYVLYYQVQADDRLYLNAVVEDHSGWVGIGLNGNGGMKGASVMIVRKDGEAWVAEDRHSMDYATPILDEQQDVGLESAEEINGKINVTFSLPINSCDQNDYPVLDSKQTVIWALGSGHAFAYHGQNVDVDRGTSTLNFISGPQDSVDPADGFTVDIKMPNVRIEGGPHGEDARNPYVCAAVDISQLGLAEGTYHITKYEPLVQPSSRHIVHHMVGNPCLDGAPRYVKGSDPTTWFQVDCEQMIDCTGAYFLGGPGMGSVVFPPEAGLLLETRRVQYFALQVHYYNPSLISDLTDSSGFRLTMTPTLRPSNVGVYILNAGFNNRMTFPLEPGMAEVWRGMQVPPGCNDDTWPPALDEVNVLAIYHHAHGLGTKVEINVIRNRTNVGLLRNEKIYDFKHQAFVPSNVPILKRTDTLDVRCKYDTTAKTEPVDFGYSTHREMCIGGMYYYPAAAAFYYAKPGRRDPPQSSVEDVACGLQRPLPRHVFERIPLAPSPACSPRGIARLVAASASVSIASTAISIGSGETLSSSNVDVVNSKTSYLTMSWAIQRVALISAISLLVLGGQLGVRSGVNLYRSRHACQTGSERDTLCCEATATTLGSVAGTI